MEFLIGALGLGGYFAWLIPAVRKHNRSRQS